MDFAGTLITSEIPIGRSPGSPAREDCEGRVVLSLPGRDHSRARCRLWERPPHRERDARGGIWGRWAVGRRMRLLQTQAAFAAFAWSSSPLCRGDLPAPCRTNFPMPFARQHLCDVWRICPAFPDIQKPLSSWLSIDCTSCCLSKNMLHVYNEKQRCYQWMTWKLIHCTSLSEKKWVIK